MLTSPEWWMSEQRVPPYAWAQLRAKTKEQERVCREGRKEGGQPPEGVQASGKVKQLNWKTKRKLISRLRVARSESTPKAEPIRNTGGDGEYWWQVKYCGVFYLWCVVYAGKANVSGALCIINLQIIFTLSKPLSPILFIINWFDFYIQWDFRKQIKALCRTYQIILLLLSFFVLFDWAL